MKYSVIIRSFKEVDEGKQLRFYIEGKDTLYTAIYPNTLPDLSFSRLLLSSDEVHIVDLDVDENVKPYMVKDIIIDGVSQLAKVDAIHKRFEAIEKLRKEMSL